MKVEFDFRSYFDHYPCGILIDGYGYFADSAKEMIGVLENETPGINWETDTFSFIFTEDSWFEPEVTIRITGLEIRKLYSEKNSEIRESGLSDGLPVNNECLKQEFKDIINWLVKEFN